MEKVLEVRNLKISFRTSGGILKAVRGISFDLAKGRTMAIVGESGSGKSVTSKAVLGILAGNSIVEGGEILYDGRDLLKVSEEEMCGIRGDRISMIFQDPLSSLNPIVKIGKQITEAMILKNEGNRKAAGEEFNGVLAVLKECIIAAVGEPGREKVTEMIRTFDRFNIEAVRMENSYNSSEEAVKGILSDAEEFLFLASKKQIADIGKRLGALAGDMKRIRDPFLMHGYTEELSALAAEIQLVKTEYKPRSFKNGTEIMPPSVIALFEKVRAVMEALLARTRPDFFRIGYYKMKHPEENLSGISVDELNQSCLLFLDRDFMLEFIDLMSRGMEYSANTAVQKKKSLLPVLKDARKFFEQTWYDRGTAQKKAKELGEKVLDSIDRLRMDKDSQLYTFPSAISGAVDRYFCASEKDTKEEMRAEIIAVVDRLMCRLEENISESGTIDFRACSIDLVDWFKEKASGMVYRITGRMAKEKAIELMEEVGIPDPRTRYVQYPFEFSGGMRQRIVIAIALAANPDILICDEPTTALDVTIQAQILELIGKLRKERNLSVIFITHDLGVVANIADDIAVMYAGRIVEYGTAEDIFYDPRHPYTWALLASMPDLETTEKLESIPGTPPNMIHPPAGDAFAERNRYAMKIDFEQHPPQFWVSDTHWAATWLLHPDAPEVQPPKIIADRIERMKHGGEN